MRAVLPPLASALALISLLAMPAVGAAPDGNPDRATTPTAPDDPGASDLGASDLGASDLGLRQMPALTVASPEKSEILGAARAGKRIVAVGDNGAVILSDDDGKSFRQARTVPTRQALTAVTFVNASDGWAVGHWGMVLHSSDGGESWNFQRQDLSVDQPLFSVWFADAQTGFAVGLWSIMLGTHDAGQHWTLVQLPRPPDGGKTDKNLYDIFSDRRGDVIVAAEQGLIYRSTDNGQTWASVKTGNMGSFWAGIALHDGSMLIGGLGGKLYRSTDAGKSWTALDSGTTSSITALAETENGQVTGTALDGMIIESKDGGSGMTAAQRDNRDTLTAIIINSAGQPVIFSSTGVEPSG